jgi:hypothetical protein
MHIDWIIPFYVALCAIPAIGFLIVWWIIGLYIWHFTRWVWEGLTHGRRRRA